MSSEGPHISELAGLFSGGGNMQGDVAEAFELMREHLHKKYTAKMLDAVSSYKSNVSKNPSAEVKLLTAFKPFVHESSHSQIDRLIDALQTYGVLLEFQNEYGNVNMATASAANTDEAFYAAQSAFSDTASNESVHSDGVYDIDEKCIVTGGRNPSGFGNMAGVIMLMTYINNR